MFAKYGVRLLKGIFKGNWSCYDALAANLTAFIMAMAGFVANTVNIFLRLICGESLIPVVICIAQSFVSSYLGLFFLGLAPLITEWKRIKASSFKKVLYLFTYPIYIFTNMPIALSSLVCKVTWKPIIHTRSLTLEEISAGGEKNDRK